MSVSNDAKPGVNSYSLRDIDAVLSAFEEGRLTPAQAFSLFREMGPQFEAPPGQGQDAESSNASRLREALNELDSLIGLHSVKRLVREILAFVQIQKKRARQQLATEHLVLHMIFKGNPGTGKTTVARIMGKIFRETGVLERGHLIEVERADLVGEYIGHTAQKTREQIRKALGGILFIDEAYSLARGGEKDFGKEAIDTLVKSMEDYRDRFILILAGYSEEMNYFIQTNPGIRSRFPIHIDFPDYLPDELIQIAELMLKKREYKLDPWARNHLYTILTKHASNLDHNAGNARFVRNIIERAIRRQAVRLVDKENPTREELMLIRREDIGEGL